MKINAILQGWLLRSHFAGLINTKEECSCTLMNIRNCGNAEIDDCQPAELTMAKGGRVTEEE